MPVGCALSDGASVAEGLLFIDEPAPGYADWVSGYDNYGSTVQGYANAFVLCAAIEVTATQGAAAKTPDVGALLATERAKHATG